MFWSESDRAGGEHSHNVNKMKPLRSVHQLIVAFTFCLVLTGGGALRAEEPETDAAAKVAPPTTMLEARSRALLLFEMVHGTLQVVHRDFFEEDDALAIPSASLEDVFHELSVSFDVNFKWLIVNADALNVDHQPADAFEKRAAEALAEGKPMLETNENGRYRFAGPIRLPSQCLKCHVKRRTSNTDRTAGLLISMPLQAAAAEKETAP
ncbi:c-type heme family protein [Roseimaritima ulvae]|nr:DUF3365 domain-containing protein [Roseimaritima ulvae]